MPTPSSPPIIFTTHAIYQWGTAVSKLLNNNYSFNLYVWGTNPYARSLISFANGPHILYPKLNVGLQKQAATLAERLNLAGSPDLANTYDAITDINSIEKSIDNFISQYDKVVLLAPNCTWDADIVEQHTIFGGIVEWICKTCQFIESTDFNLNVGIIIRVHPAEASLWKSLPHLQDQLPDSLITSKRILFISGSFKISSAQISSKCNLSIVYSGKTIQEIAWTQSTPILVPSGSIDSSTPGAYKPSSLEDYYSMITNTLKHDKPYNGFPALKSAVEAFHQDLHGTGFSISDKIPYPYSSGLGIPMIDKESLSLILKWCISRVN